MIFRTYHALIWAVLLLPTNVDERERAITLICEIVFKDLHSCHRPLQSASGFHYAAVLLLRQVLRSVLNSLPFQVIDKSPEVVLRSAH